MKSLKIAIQKKGHLRDESLLFLNSLGINCQQIPGQLTAKCPKTNIEIIFLRDDDIPTYINKNLIDFGIIGEDLILESQPEVRAVKKLGFSQCQLVLASPAKNQIKNLNNLSGKRIATSYPNILKKFLAKNKIQSEIITVSGSVEVAPQLNLADAVCDLTQTGSTLKQCQLRKFATILKSEAILIENSSSNPAKKQFLNLCK